MSEVFNFIYRGGVSKENNVRYLTAEKPPTDDNSNKVPTTEWVRDALDAASSGAYPTVSKITTTMVKHSSCTTTAPSGGGTWYCYGSGSYNTYHTVGGDEKTTFNYNDVYASGATIVKVSGNIDYCSGTGFGIKIA